MKVEQIYTKCLSQGSYYIESNNEVAIIDPIREIDTYIEKAKKNKSKIKYIFETHIHADFISGHLNLAKKTNAKIIYGPKSETNFVGFSTKSEINPLFNFTTPNALGSSTCFTQIAPSASAFNVKSALNKVSAKATTQGPVKDSLAQKIA